MPHRKWRSQPKRILGMVLGGLGCFVIYIWCKIIWDTDLRNIDNSGSNSDDLYHNEDHFQNVLSPFPVLPQDARRRQQTTLPVPPLNESDVIPDPSSFLAQLKEVLLVQQSSPVILSIIDYGFIDMALNFIKLSIEKPHLRSYFMPVCLDRQSVLELSSHGYQCILLDIGDKQSLEASDFGTEGYYRKTNLKTWVVLQVLKFSHTVLLSDVDIVIFKDPFPYFTCSDCDLHIQMDKVLYNSGFVYVRPTNGSLMLYSNAWEFYLQYHKGHDQAYINMAITMLEKSKSVKIESLSWRQFPCGAYYFEHDFRTFYNLPDCPQCVMAHNNYLGSTAAKIYRFKENLLWTTSIDKAYYSNTHLKYLTYENPYDFQNNTLTQETNALITALIIANLTNRILILPSFRCCNCNTKTCDHPKNRCSLLSVLKIKLFDEYFKGKYREHSFFRNNAVPIAVKNSTSPIIHIDSKIQSSNYSDISKYIDIYGKQLSVKTFNIPAGVIAVNDVLSIIKEFSGFSVIRLHSMYFELSEFQSLATQLKEYVKCGLYEQWEESLQNKLFKAMT